VAVTKTMRAVFAEDFMTHRNDPSPAEEGLPNASCSNAGHNKATMLQASSAAEHSNDVTKSTHETMRIFNVCCCANKC
jgi:hypothetical protein